MKLAFWKCIPYYTHLYDIWYTHFSCIRPVVCVVELLVVKVASTHTIHWLRMLTLVRLKVESMQIRSSYHRGQTNQVCTSRGRFSFVKGAIYMRHKFTDRGTDWLVSLRQSYEHKIQTFFPQIYIEMKYSNLKYFSIPQYFY